MFLRKHHPGQRLELLGVAGAFSAVSAPEILTWRSGGGSLKHTAVPMQRCPAPRFRVAHSATHMRHAVHRVLLRRERRG